MRKVLATTATAALLLSGCAALPARDTPGDFHSMMAGQIAAANVPQFSDCLMDGFTKAHSTHTHVPVRQQRRADGYRVETFDGDSQIIMTSVDVLDTGHVELFESRFDILVSTTDEHATFTACLSKFAS